MTPSLKGPRTGLAHCNELIGLMVDCEFTIGDFELIAHHAKGPLLEATENQLIKMDKAATEKVMENLKYEDMAYPDHEMSED